jgi:hypothetical protein
MNLKKNLTFRVGRGHHIEEKGLHVVVESLVVEKAFGDEAEVLAVLLVLLPAHLEDGELVLPIDLVAGRVAPHALSAVSLHHAEITS